MTGVASRGKVLYCCTKMNEYIYYIDVRRREHVHNSLFVCNERGRFIQLHWCAVVFACRCWSQSLRRCIIASVLFNLVTELNDHYNSEKLVSALSHFSNLFSIRYGTNQASVFV